MSAPEPCAVNVLTLCEALPATPTAPMSAVTHGEGNPGLFVTVMVEVAVLPWSCVVTVIVAVPTATAVTSPELFTVATEVLLDDQLTFLFVALAGATVAVSCWVVPTTFDAEVGVT